MTAVYTKSAFALSVQIPRIDDDRLIGGVPAHDLAGIDIEASKDRYDAMLLAIVQAEYPGAEFGDDFRVYDQDGNADTAAAREVSDWIANEAEHLFNSGAFWIEETYPPIGGGSQELDTQYNGWTTTANAEHVRELIGWIDNTERLYDQQVRLRDAMKRHLLLGTFDADRARAGYQRLADAAARDYARPFPGYRFNRSDRSAVASEIMSDDIDRLTTMKEFTAACDQCDDIDNGYTGPGISFFGLHPKTGGTTLVYCTCETGQLRRAYWDYVRND